MPASTNSATGLFRRCWGLIRYDAAAACAALVALLSIGWFAAGPAAGQRPVVRVVTPLLAGLIALGQWRAGADPRLSGSASRFWRILALGMFTYTGGMVLDLVVLVLRDAADIEIGDIGQIAFYPVAALLSLGALVAFPTAPHRPIERVKLGLDMATVLFGSATFVWYFVSSKRWDPDDGWEQLSDGLVLPALVLVAGFAILRITLAGANIICRPTLLSFVFGALTAAAGIIVGPRPDTPSGRVSSTLHVLGLAACVIGMAVQLRRGPGPPTGARSGWRRQFTVLPYGAVAATMALLLLVVGGRLNHRGWVVVVGVLALCAVVMARQLAALWENARLLAVNQDLTRQLHHRAFHDELTELVNRALFTEQVGVALSRDATAAVLLIDLDDFKVVNDSLGHQAGDQLLRAVAERLGATVEPQHLLGRLGGDEFAVLVEGESDAGVRAVADSIVAALDAPFRVGGAQVRVRASVGIAAVRGGRRDTAELLRNADIAMYAAKRTHKGGWRVFEPGMLSAVLARHRLQAALAQAVERDEFVVFYQPIVDLADGSLRGAEALVRWRRTDGRLMAPDRFIGLAEETGLVAEIDRRVLSVACAQVMRWPLPLGLHVNVSARQLHRANLVAEVSDVLAATGLEPQRLTLEITESGLGGDAEVVAERLVALAGLGIHLAIDDFGTGYSSLACLRRMPVDVLKIDKSFVAELVTEDGCTPLAQAVVALADTLGMQTVAEGIEHPTQVSRLLVLGCRYGQGFLFAEPLPAAGMAAFVREQATREPITS